MTDRTHIIRYALELGLLWVDGDGRDKVREALDALAALEAQLEAIGAGGVQEDKDLRRRCVECVEWQQTGELREGALRAYAKKHWPWHHDSLQMAERATETQAMRAVASWGTHHAPPAEQQAAPKAAPAGWKLVPVEPTADQEWAGKNAALRCSTMGEACKIYKAMLAASPAPPAEQQACDTPKYCNSVQRCTARDEARAQAAPKAAPGGQNTVPAEWLEQAYREGWAACRDAETIGEEAEDWAFGNSTANSRMIDAQQAAPKQEAQEPIALLVRKNSWRAGQWETAPPDSPTYGLAWADHRQYVYAAPQPAPAPLSDDFSQKTWALLDELEKLRGADRYEEDWDTLNKRDSELRAAIAARGDRDA